MRTIVKGQDSATTASVKIIRINEARVATTGASYESGGAMVGAGGDAGRC